MPSTNNNKWTAVRPQRKTSKKLSMTDKGKSDKIITPKTHFNVNQFLSSFKTVKCPKVNEHHDHRFCRYFHDYDKDRRRDPFLEYYALEDTTNPTEKMYHPDMFRTQFCSRKINTGSCHFKDMCAYAHLEHELREKETASNSYFERMHQKEPSQRSLQTFVPVPAEKFHHKQKTFNPSLMWEQPSTRSKARQNYLLSMERGSVEWFMVKSSAPFWEFLKEMALEEGLCFLEKIETSWEKGRNPGISIQGVDIGSAVNRVLDALSAPPEKYFISREKPILSKRVLKGITSILSKGQDDFIPRKFQSLVFVGVSHDVIKACCVNNNSGLSRTVLDQVFEKVDFWTKREGYDQFNECCCCMEDSNADEGITCPNGHFFCSVGTDDEQCFNLLVKSSIPQLKGQDGNLLCSICGVGFNTQTAAHHLPQVTWEAFQSATMDIKIQSRVDQLATEFDRRLQEKVSELLSNYGSAEDMFKERAKLNAAKARNEALNLKCPHCQTVYAEFTGCMALCCATCKGSFCGYCHKPTASSRGAHEHVRECLMNETRNGSYYATEEEIINAQRRYRTRQIKQFLRSYKKNEQNAIIIELNDDLRDLEIDSEALFEFGNLQD